jgi:ethanolamine utilization microcompartment shell protein EutS
LKLFERRQPLEEAARGIQWHEAGKEATQALLLAHCNVHIVYHTLHDESVSTLIVITAIVGGAFVHFCDSEQ